MALARIITRSQLCSRALALDLLARGYTVEIVSPDKIPDNFADLELRVDNSVDSQLIANVATHGGGRTASLEFVHHLKAPMVNFMRRPPEHDEADHFSGEPVRFEGVPGIQDQDQDLELPVETPQLAPSAVSPITEIPLKREHDSQVDSDVDPKVDPKEGARPPVLQVQSLPPVESPGYFAAEDAAASQPTKDVAMAQAIVAAPVVVSPSVVLPIVVSPITVSPITVPPMPGAELRPRSAGWPWRVALIFVSMVLLAAVLGLRVRRTTTTKDAAPDFEALPHGEIGVASTGVNPTSIGAEKDPTKDPRQASVVSLSPTAAASEVKSSQPPKQAPAAQVGASIPSPRTTVSGNDFIARDTVIYLDKRFKPTPKNPLAKDRLPGIRNRTTQAGAIAANTISDLNKTAPKVVK